MNVVSAGRETRYILAIFLVGSLLVSSASAQTLKWETLWGESGFDVAQGVAVDYNGYIYITGLTYGGPIGWDAFVASFDPSGVLKNQFFWGTSSIDYATDIVLDTLGNVYITGYTSSGPVGGEDAFVASFDSSGDLRWRSFWGTLDSDRAFGITLDVNRNVYITGATAKGDVSWDEGDAFVASFSPSGVLRWQAFWDFDIIDVAYDVALDGYGNVYIAGGTAPTGYGVWYAFIVSYDPSGVLRWEAFWGEATIACDWANGVTLDEHGNVYIAGVTLIFGPFGDDDAFVASFNSSSGALRWQTWLGTPGLESAHDVAIFHDKIYVVGETSQGPFGDVDAFVASFNSSSGALGWQAWWGTSGLDRALGVAVDESANIYMTGYTAPSVSGDYRAFLVCFSQESVPPEPPPPSVPEFPLGTETIMILGSLIAAAYIWWNRGQKQKVECSLRSRIKN